MMLKLKPPLTNFSVGVPFGFVLPQYTQQDLKGHPGIDCTVPTGTPIFATHDGKVSYTGADSAGGLIVVIRTETQFEDDDGDLHYWKTIYVHLSEIKVIAGKNVKTGDLIGLSGNTGMSAGPHLHFGLKPIAQGENSWTWYNVKQQNGYQGAVDPLRYFETLPPPTPLPNYFKTQELVPKSIYAQYGEQSLWFVDSRLLNLLNFIRGWFGKPVIVNNGSNDQRCFRPPESTIGAKFSQHRFGRGADITVIGMTPGQVHAQILANEKVFMDKGLTCLEDIKDTPFHVHIDVRFTGLSKILIVSGG